MAKERLLDFLKLHFTPCTPANVVPSTSKQRVFLLRATWVLLNRPSGQYSFSIANMRKGKNTVYS